MRELLAGLLEANLAAAAAVCLVLLLRRSIRSAFGAGAAYRLWLVVPAAMLATLIPARTFMTVAGPGIDMSGAASSSVAAVETTPPAWFETLLALFVETLPYALPWLWATGAMVMLALLILRQTQFGADVRDGRAGPAVVGFLRPRIVTPNDFDTRYNAREQALVLAHERIHLARHDARINTLAALARCACWFNPLIHVGVHMMRIDQEMSCDAAVVARRPRARRAYAQALLKTQLAERPLPAGCYWPAGTHHPLTERITMLNIASPTGARRAIAAALLAALTAGAGLAAWAVQPETPAPQPAGAPVPVLVKGRVTQVMLTADRISFDSNDPAKVHMDKGHLSIHLTEESTGRKWIIDGPEGDSLAFDKTQALDDAIVEIRGFQPANDPCDPACLALARDIAIPGWTPASGPNADPEPSPAPAPAPAPQKSDTFSDFTGRNYDPDAPVLLQGPVTRIETRENGFLVHMTLESTGAPWIVSGTAKDGVTAANLTPMTGKVVKIRAYQSADRACDPACWANGRDIAVVGGLPPAGAKPQN